MDTLGFGYDLPTAGWSRDFHPLERALAGRTHGTAAVRISLQQSFFCPDTFLFVSNAMLSQRMDPFLFQEYGFVAKFHTFQNLCQPADGKRTGSPVRDPVPICFPYLIGAAPALP